MNTLRILTPEVLRTYNPYAPTHSSHRRLPHWHQKRTCAFVTFRLQDSLPESARHEYLQKKTHWLRLKGWPTRMTESEILENLSAVDHRRFQRFASSQYQRILDRGLGSCALITPAIRTIVEEALWHGAGSKYLLGDFVIMPNHVHALMQPMDDHDLKKILGNLRHYTARIIHEQLQQKGSFWQAEPFDHLVRSRFYFKKYQRYIQLNPIRAKLRKHEYTLFSMKA